MNVKLGIMFENGVIVPQEMESKACLMFGKHTVTSGDQVCIWSVEGATIVGEIWDVIGRKSVAIRISNQNVLRISYFDIKEIAKKIDGEWVIMEVKE